MSDSEVNAVCSMEKQRERFRVLRDGVSMVVEVVVVVAVAVGFLKLLI